MNSKLENKPCINDRCTESYDDGRLSNLIQPQEEISDQSDYNVNYSKLPPDFNTDFDAEPSALKEEVSGTTLLTHVSTDQDGSSFYSLVGISSYDQSTADISTNEENSIENIYCNKNIRGKPRYTSALKSQINNAKTTDSSGKSDAKMIQRNPGYDRPPKEIDTSAKVCDPPSDTLRSNQSCKMFSENLGSNSKLKHISAKQSEADTNGRNQDHGDDSEDDDRLCCRDTVKSLSVSDISHSFGSQTQVSNKNNKNKGSNIDQTSSRERTIGIASLVDGDESHPSFKNQAGLSSTGNGPRFRSQAQEEQCKLKPKDKRSSDLPICTKKEKIFGKLDDIDEGMSSYGLSAVTKNTSVATKPGATAVDGKAPFHDPDSGPCFKNQTQSVISPLSVDSPSSSQFSMDQVIKEDSFDLPLYSSKEISFVDKLNFGDKVISSHELHDIKTCIKRGPGVIAIDGAGKGLYLKNQAKSRDQARNEGVCDLPLYNGKETYHSDKSELGDEGISSFGLHDTNTYQYMEREPGAIAVDGTGQRPHFKNQAQSLSLIHGYDPPAYGPNFKGQAQNYPYDVTPDEQRAPALQFPDKKEGIPSGASENGDEGNDSHGLSLFGSNTSFERRPGANAVDGISGESISGMIEAHLVEENPGNDEQLQVIIERARRDLEQQAVQASVIEVDEMNRKKKILFASCSLAAIVVLTLVIVIPVLLTADNAELSWEEIIRRYDTVPFETNLELREAVVAYASDYSATSEVARKYGYPIGAWDVSRISNFSKVFSNIRLDMELDLKTWNVSAATSMESMFAGAWAFQGDISTWDVSNVRDMSWMFYDADTFNGMISSWTVSSVTSMAHMFDLAVSFDAELNDWNTSQVRNMECMFCNAYTFNKNVSKWDVSQVTTMADMFHTAQSFNSDVIGWNTSNVQNMEAMFWDAYSFNKDLYSWDVSYVTSMRHMFHHAKSFNKNLDSWKVSNVTDMTMMFWDARSFVGSVASWDVSRVTAMDEIFCYAQSFRQELDKWDVSNIKNMSRMFYDARSFNNRLSSWNVSQVITMAHMFDNAQSFNQDLNSWDVSNVQNMEAMFANAYSFDGDISSWKTNRVTTMKEMFHTAMNFNKDLNRWSVSNVKNMDAMFLEAYSFNGQVSSWDISGLNSTKNMFSRAYAFNQSLDDWNFANVEVMDSMFSGARSFSGLGVSSWNVSNVRSMASVFQDAVSFNQSLNDWNVANVENMEAMFFNATSFDGAISRWNTSRVSNMKAMFESAISFDKNLGAWDMSNVVNMNRMFYDADSFQGIDLAQWNLSLVEEANSMFCGAPNFIITGANRIVSNAPKLETSFEELFC